MTRGVLRIGVPDVTGAGLSTPLLMHSCWYERSCDLQQWTIDVSRPALSSYALERVWTSGSSTRVRLRCGKVCVLIIDVGNANESVLNRHLQERQSFQSGSSAYARIRCC